MQTETTAALEVTESNRSTLWRTLEEARFRYADQITATLNALPGCVPLRVDIYTGHSFRQPGARIEYSISPADREGFFGGFTAMLEGDVYTFENKSTRLTITRENLAVLDALYVAARESIGWFIKKTLELMEDPDWQFEMNLQDAEAKEKAAKQEALNKLRDACKAVRRADAPDTYDVLDGDGNNIGAFYKGNKGRWGDRSKYTEIAAGDLKGDIGWDTIGDMVSAFAVRKYPAGDRQ